MIYTTLSGVRVQSLAHKDPIKINIITDFTKLLNLAGGMPTNYFRLKSLKSVGLQVSKL